MPGPVISIGLNNAEMLLKLGDLQKAAKAAAKEIKEVEKAALRAEQQGLKVTQSMMDRLARAERVYDTAQSRIAAQEAAEARNTGRTSYAFRKWQSQFEQPEGLERAMMTGAALSHQISAVQRAFSAIDDVLDMPHQQRLRDMRRAGTFRSPLTKVQQAAEDSAADAHTELRAVEELGDTIPGPMGQLIKLLAKIGHGTVNYGEGALTRAKGDAELDDMLRAHGLRSMDKAKMLHNVSSFRELVAQVAGKLSPAQEELKERIKAADDLLQKGFEQAQRGNLVGDTRPGMDGFGGAQYYFREAHKLMPEIGPINASATYQAIEYARICDRNFARSQMARAGPRTGD